MWESHRPVVGNNEGVAATTFALPADHPGVHDAAYRARRAAIAAVGEQYRPGSPIPDVEYTAEEDNVWHVVSTQLAVKHERYACREYLKGVETLALPRDRVPQLGTVTERLEQVSGWRLEPVPGLVPTRTFYGALADRRFLSTQYIRHHSVPFYTPEPDIVHELIGHANMLGSPRFADLYHSAGRASVRATTDEALEWFSRVFWFTLEFGVVWEEGELRTYGAGLLSSYGEIEVFRDAELRPFDLDEMGRTEYDITHYQPLLYAAPSFDEMVDELTEFFDSFDDQRYRELTAS
jgi:phenylalanine-4-hydroxylase